MCVCCVQASIRVPVGALCVRLAIQVNKHYGHNKLKIKYLQSCELKSNKNSSWNGLHHHPRRVLIWTRKNGQFWLGCKRASHPKIVIDSQTTGWRACYERNDETKERKTHKKKKISDESGRERKKNVRNFNFGVHSAHGWKWSILSANDGHIVK